MTMISLLKAEAAVREQPREAAKLLRRLLLPYGGGDFFFTGGEKPLFLLDLTLPADNEAGVNFDIRLAYAVRELARECGVQQICFGVRVEDGFSFADVLEKSGYARLAELEGVRFFDLSAVEGEMRETDTGLVLDQVELARFVLEADIIISLAKFRAGEGHLFGGAMHNMRIAAKLSPEYGFAAQQRALVDIYSIIAPDLTIVDGLRGESGFQPQAEDFILAAVDAVAADAVLAAIAGIDLEAGGCLQAAAQYGLGVGEPADIRLYGDDMGEIMC